MTAKKEEETSLISFWKLLCDKKIIIPNLQRDYAQGRTDEKTTNIRRRFLKSLRDAFKKRDASEKPLELDFIYGSQEDQNLIPLDGQQRLTTLFLLHWYLAKETGHLNKENIDRFRKFTYETRVSTREFLDLLVKSSGKLGEGNKISEKIVDSNWFPLSWKKDPSIAGMLETLDVIEEFFKDFKDSEKLLFWENLTGTNSLIKFYYLELKNFGLSEDIYLKMNSRGLGLTDFEAFKAQFEEYLSKYDWEKELSYQEKFSFKIDTSWTDLFWKHLKNESFNQKIQQFFCEVALMILANPKKFSINDIEKDFGEILQNININEKVSEQPKQVNVQKNQNYRLIQYLANDESRLLPQNFPNEESFKFLYRILDTYEKNLDKILDITSKFKIKTYKKDYEWDPLWFINDQSKKLSYPLRTLFYAQTLYLLNLGNKDLTDGHAASFMDWMRVARNIVANATIDSPELFSSSLTLIEELSKGCFNIYEFLAQPQNKLKSNFAKEQTKEEIIKAKLIVKHPEIKDHIFAIEDTEFFHGQALFGLSLAGIIKSKVSDLNDPISDFDNENITKLQKLVKVIGEDFAMLDRPLPKKFNSALLILGEDKYEYFRSFKKLQYTFNNKDKYLLIKDLKFLHDNYKIIQNKFTLLLTLRINYPDSPRDQAYDNIISDYIEGKLSNQEIKPFGDLPKWRKLLIEAPQFQDLLERSATIFYDYERNIYQLSTQQRPRDENQLINIE